AIVEIAG
ncbi:hypothetical protein M4914_02365, partial [Streptomyces somaliensis DSM 40738]|nr:hypothetical protein [Streptomyces somaliensis DSM 40738]